MCPLIKKQKGRNKIMKSEYAQIKRIKQELPKDVILIYKTGNKYCCMGRDATTLAKIAGYKTERGEGETLCFFPFHMLDYVLARLIRCNHRAAVCDKQAEKFVIPASRIKG